MATAKRVMKRKTKEPAGVLLHLTETEAEVLRTIVRLIGGHDSKSPRKYTDRINRALTSAGVGYDHEHYDASGSLWFRDYPPRPKKAMKEPGQGIGQEALKGSAKGTSVVRGEPRKFQKGDRVKPLKKLSAIAKGETVEVVNAGPAGAILRSIGCSQVRNGWAEFEDLELA